MEKLVKLLSQHLGVDTDEIKAEATFESLGIDSLDTVELIMELEEELGVELDLDEEVSTVGALATFIERKLGE